MSVNKISHIHIHVHHRYSNSRRSTERVVFKTGQYNLEKIKKFQKYHVIPDIVRAFIDTRWMWTIIYCILTYLLIWLLFTFIWWLIMYIHDDFEPDHFSQGHNSTEWTPCVLQIHDFTSLFLFSIEIHTSIGYGARTITLECPGAMVTMCIESIVGTITQSFIVGIVFAKLTSPKNRAQTLLFSKNAIVNQRNRDLCLIFRVGNTRKSRIIDVSIHAFLIRCIRTGEVLSEQTALKLVDDSSENISFMFPISAIHRIDESSPFYFLSANNILTSKLEILVVFEGIIESTGQPVQAKSSYTAQEILWGHRFVQIMDYRKDKKGYVIDYSKFDETNRINTPLCSAKQLKYFYKKR
ncbi:hypothetical protein K1T71_007293 [Dendrolimus kikuchii]|uniref:Uncharacterized protein n=1 Tax=Dendrolimus kikuchii TaxID=765133 RepID=A0ACC1CZY5_9NEOP|nr:hypothetical protein K1T71_007293 [Dendrolimus kikuchii]